MERTRDLLLSAARAMAPIDAMFVGSLSAAPNKLVLHSCESSERVVDPSLGTSGSRILERSPSQWSQLQAWAREGETLTQHSVKRSGKLAWLTPEGVEHTSIAIPLRMRDSRTLSEAELLGAMVFVPRYPHAIDAKQREMLEQLADPAWWMLHQRHLIEELQELRKFNGAGSTLLEPSSRTTASETIVGSESGLRAVMERVSIVSPSDMPVLILGETGTGKEVIARAIHHRSMKTGGPFLRVNCGAIPPELIDSQLFGHERGSFTGASDTRKGWFERASGGTLFLDEIGELPMAAQVRLLRVLQEHQIERVGGHESLHVDVRIVAATHRDLANMVRLGTFREDLWYRVNMFPILLPRLRDRVEDIPSLARHFARRAAERFGLHYVEPGPSEMSQLMAYEWPGNIRELHAVMDRAVILGRGTHLDVSTSLGHSFNPEFSLGKSDDEPTYYEVIPESAPARVVHPESARSEGNEPIVTLDLAMTKHIQRALAATSGKIEGKTGAASMLGINPHTLRARMRKLRIDWDTYRKQP